jgi:hypothetical protein
MIAGPTFPARLVVNTIGVGGGISVEASDATGAAIQISDGLKRGDLFEIILLQIEGGSARWPSREDILRLRHVGRHHRARTIVLADWQKGHQPTLYRLSRRLGPEFDIRQVWNEVAPEEVFT